MSSVTQSSMTPAPDLSAETLRLARTPVLLVACDFDGTLAHLAPRPDEARIEQAALDALRALIALPHTHVAIVSGRGLEQLRTMVAGVTGARLVGSHGAEFDGDRAAPLTDDETTLRGRLLSSIRRHTAPHPGLFAEEKPLGAALHFRLADDATAATALDAIRCDLAGDPEAGRLGMIERNGHRLVEWSVRAATKADAVANLTRRLGITATAFIGDDITDEDAFRALGADDLGLRVGDGATAARHRVADPAAVSNWLVRLCEARASFLREGHAVAIERHTLLSDQRTVALLTPDARVTWMCLPRIDSPALFAELLGGPMAGRFAIAPLGEAASSAPEQRWLGASFACETRWSTLRITDFLDASSGRAFMRAGRTDLVRIIEGTGDIEIDFAPRIDFGRQPTRLRVVPDGLAIDGTLDPITLRAPGVTWTIVAEGLHERARAVVSLGPDPLVLELRYGLQSTREIAATPASRLTQTRRFWELWAESLRLPSLHRDLVLRSALVLKALCHGPTGSVAAAATTSLPEWIGGVRNWDYRFCWLRDGAMSAIAVARLGSKGMGARFLDWMLGILDTEGTPERFRPVYSVTGGQLGAEAELSDLVGYRGSRPVRVGNAAAQQLQLDVYGPILELLATLAADGFALSAEHWRLTEAIVRAVGLRWTEPDHGIWEVRGPLRHHVHSKVMCWLAVDRGIAIADAFASAPPPDWLRLRDTIAAEIHARGWNESAGSYTAAYDESTVDAASLSVGLAGLLPGDHPRVRSTIEAVERSLRSGSTVYRYRFDDGLPGDEGGFQLCTAWLIESLANAGEVERAGELLEQYVASFGPTGLAAEEVDPATGESLGNFPQAYTHIGLIHAVLAYSRAVASARGHRP
jgi:trehalose 6-phosphate phosphatase